MTKLKSILFSIAFLVSFSVIATAQTSDPSPSPSPSPTQAEAAPAPRYSIDVTYRWRRHYLGATVGAIFDRGNQENVEVYVLDSKTGLYGDLWLANGNQRRDDFSREKDYTGGLVRNIGKIRGRAVKLDSSISWYAIHGHDVLTGQFDLSSTIQKEKIALTPGVRVELYTPFTSKGPRKGAFFHSQFGVTTPLGKHSSLWERSRITVITFSFECLAQEPT